MVEATAAISGIDSGKDEKKLENNLTLVAGLPGKTIRGHSWANVGDRQDIAEFIALPPAAYHAYLPPLGGTPRNNSITEYLNNLEPRHGELVALGAHYTTAVTAVQTAKTTVSAAIASGDPEGALNGLTELSNNLTAVISRYNAVTVSINALTNDVKQWYIAANIIARAGPNTNTFQNFHKIVMGALA